MSKDHITVLMTGGRVDNVAVYSFWRESCIHSAQIIVCDQGWAIALFGANPSFFCQKEQKKSERAIHSFALFLKRAKERFALLRSF